MAAPLKLSTDQIAFARAVVEKRREAERQVSMYPTIPQLAAQLGIGRRYLQKILSGETTRSDQLEFIE